MPCVWALFHSGSEASEAGGADQKRGRRLEKSGAETLKNEVLKAAASAAAVPKPSVVFEKAAAEGTSEQDALEKEKKMKRAERLV